MTGHARTGGRRPSVLANARRLGPLPTAGTRFENLIIYRYLISKLPPGWLTDTLEGPKSALSTRAGIHVVPRPAVSPVPFHYDCREGCPSRTPDAPARFDMRRWLFAALWMTVIFATSCTVVFRPAFVNAVGRALPGPELPGLWGRFWLSRGLLVVKGYHVAEFLLLYVLVERAWPVPIGDVPASSRRPSASVSQSRTSGTRRSCPVEAAR